MRTSGTDYTRELTSSQQSKTTTEQPTTAPSDPLRALGEALRAEASGKNDDQTGGGDEGHGKPPGNAPGEKPKPKPKSLEAVAEALGLEVADLYEVAIPAKAKGAEALSLGKLKDLAAEHGEFTVKSLRLDEDRRTFENAKVTHEQELRALLEALPAEAIKPEKLAKLREALGKKQAAQRERVLELLPEWQDEKVRGAELKGMTEFLKTYDLPESYLLVNLDARVVRLVRDAYQRTETIRKALEKITEKKPAAHGKAGTTEPPKRGRTAPTPLTRRDSQVAGFMQSIQNATSQR